MAIYDIHCPECGKRAEMVRAISRFDDPLPECCGSEMRRLPCAPRIMSDIAEYDSLMDGTRITSRSHHREHMRAHGVEELGDATPASLEPEKHRREIDWKQAAVEAAEQITQTKSAKWLKKNLS